MVRHCRFLLYGFLILAACKQRQDAITTNKFADSVLVRIGEWQDQRRSDSLITFLTNENARYREEALLALASVQDSSVVTSVGGRLKDDDRSVREAAAFALGQTRCHGSEELLREALLTEKDRYVRARLYEAYGRTAARWEIRVPVPADTVEAAGMAWGIFRTAGDSLLNPLAAKLLENRAVTVRLGAAHYFARKAPHPKLAAFQLVRLAQKDPSEDVRMAAALSLRKVPTDETFAALANVLRNESSYRVRVNAVSALQGFPPARARPLLMQSLQDENMHVAVRAAEVIVAQPMDTAWQELVAKARAANHFRVKALLYQAAMSSVQDQSLYQEIRDLCTQSADAYQKAAYLGALGKTLMAFSFVKDELLNADTAAIRTAAASAIAEMNRSRNFTAALRPEFLDVYREAINLGDLGVTSVVCDVLSDPDLEYKSIVHDWAFLLNARTKLRLPADNETLQAVEGAIAYFEGKTPQPVRNAFNHPIDWRYVQRIPIDQRARIVTSKGVVIIRLFVEEAPGSVSNFLALVRKARYDGKYFHRVVPNFVAQGGCPRGDGFGSEPYSIRSEFSRRRYKTGSAGLASAGKDTESSQWFITHSPTPHLDGSYTIFAEVTDGMEVVHQLGVGDKILKIELQDKTL